MPTYEFECSDCGDRFDIILNINEPQPALCARCGGALGKVFHPIGIIFKGSGYYVNDNKTAINGAAKPPAARANQTAVNTPVNGTAGEMPDSSNKESQAGAGGK